ncbi:phage SPO1 DNA polymerase-related protein [Oscillochloris trichoides DG-6]|uniref:Type-4 uracil-DNA glycosylase n=1 Tax=Oscillochloris trichoides DG-6 TaxID=765420 RepID=E1IBZ0_9CHLR|nr:uracil-DNA glycosylase [Oscillochloris trichoides]EFO81318.1 phage SPO1 DNA polymerase-related protein [Oscillochloris trichoides DG-6]
MSAETIQLIAQEVRTCTLCGLANGRTRAVPGEGPADARIMVIGEGPGFHEDRQGRPFVGPSGKFLDDLLAMAGLSRETVFIANVVKCRPPQNRDPQPDEIAICTEHYLYRQIVAIDPPVIVTLGRFSMSLFMPGERIMRVHGQPRNIDGRLVVPMLHPAAALHQPQNRPLIEADFRRLPEILAQAEAALRPAATEPKASDEPPLEQLSLF